MNKRGLAADVTASHPADILIVDDTVETSGRLAPILAGQSDRVRKAMSRTMTLTAVKSVLPDLIGLDIGLPELDGYTLGR